MRVLTSTVCVCTWILEVLYVSFVHLLELELVIQTQVTHDIEANTAGRSGSARALRKQSKCGIVREGGGIGQKSRKIAKSEAFVGIARPAEQ